MRYQRGLVVLSAVLFGWCGLVGAAPEKRELREIFPEKSLIYLELDGARSTYEAFLSSKAWLGFEASAVFLEFRQSPDWDQFQAGRRTVGYWLDIDPVELFFKTVGQRAALAAWERKGGGMNVGIVAFPDSASALRTAFQRVSDLVRTQGEDRVSSQNGIDFLQLDEAVLALDNGQVVLASDKKTALLLIQKARKLPASAKSGSSSGLEIEVDLAAVRRVKGHPGGPQRPDEPLPILAAAGLTDIIGAATVLRFLLEPGNEGVTASLSLNAGLTAMEPAIRGLYSAGTVSGLEIGNESDILSLSLARDVGLFWEKRRELLPPRMRAGLAEAQNILSIFFSGPPEEVLSGLVPPISIIVSPQEFPAGGPTPRMRLPSVALHAVLRDPEKLGERLSQAFQSAVVLSNLDRGKKGGTPLSLGFAAAGQGAQILRAYFPAPDQQKDQADLRYNLRPACGRSGGDFVLSTSEDQVRKLLGRSAPPAASTGEKYPIDRLVVHGPALAEALTQAMPILVPNRMVEEGQTREEATRDLEMISQVSRLIRSLEAELRYADSETDLRIRVQGAGGEGI